MKNYKLFNSFCEFISAPSKLQLIGNDTALIKRFIDALGSKWAFNIRDCSMGYTKPAIEEKFLILKNINRLSESNLRDLISTLSKKEYNKHRILLTSVERNFAPIIHSVYLPSSEFSKLQFHIIFQTFIEENNPLPDIQPTNKSTAHDLTEKAQYKLQKLPDNSFRIIFNYEEIQLKRSDALHYLYVVMKQATKTPIKVSQLYESKLKINLNREQPKGEELTVTYGILLLPPVSRSEI